MKIVDALKNDYFRLFVKREGKVVLGKNYSSLWLLTGVLTATFLAIAFSNASLNYLSYKMDDPFINWVDIKNEFGEGDFFGLEYALEADNNKETFHYGSFQSDHSFSFMFFGKTDDNVQYLKCRFFEDINTTLVEEILNKDNVIRNWRVKDLSAVDPNTVGVIITEEAIKKLGYEIAPTFIDVARVNDGADYYGFTVDALGQARCPVPVLGVVERLPGNVDVISSTYFYKQQLNDYTYPFNLCKDKYARNLSYFVPADMDLSKFHEAVKSAAAEYTDAEIEMDEYTFYTPEIIPFREGNFVSMECFQDRLDYDVWRQINAKVLDEYADKGVYRVIAYDFSPYDLSQKSFISVHFNDLDKIRDFEIFVRENYKVKIEMSQINAKENFNAVSTMGNILSWGIIVFAIVCIILFIVNLLQSYFQKVKRNLGTFKAFGISNRDLISVYVLIMAAIVLAAIFMSISVAWFIQGLMHVCGILKDGLFDYLYLWSGKTVCSIAIIIMASVYTVFTVMRNLLKATPGDLIYDRQ